MDEKAEIIPYRSVPKWLFPAVATSCGAGSLAVLLSSASLALFICPGWVGAHATLMVIEVFVRAVALLILGFCCYISFEVARNDILVISDDGMRFPLLLSPDLLFRPRRNWDDVGNILIGAMLLEDKRGTYEYELEETKDKKKLFIYFKSGGHVALDLNKMPRESVERIFKAVEDWCIACTRVPQASTKERGKKRSDKGQKNQALTYTQMWEDELQSHFSATNFVPLEKGSSLQSGKWTVLMQISSGGLSAVYLAETVSKELVVIKEAALPSNLQKQTQQKARELFHREALILRELSHPRVAKVLDFFVERGREYLALEFIAGESLRQIVKKRGIQSEKAVLDIALQVAKILDYLHDQEPPVVHRDITPDNLILKENGEVVLIDFGAANHYLGTATGTLVGKQCYIAPEQFRGKACIQSDYYALGGTLFFLLTGKDPEALSRSSPSESREDISRGLNKLVEDMTSIMLENRIASASDIIERIEPMISDTVLTFSTADG